MAAYYYKQMKASMKPGNIILGGWSFGGLLALEVANAIILDKSGGFKVIGLVLIDSGYPLITDVKSASLETLQNLLNDDLVKHTPKKVLESMDRSIKKVAEWKLSRWPQGFDKPPTVLIRAAEGLDTKCNLTSDLSWEFCEHNVVDSVQTVPGNHFSIFKSGNVEILSTKLQDLCKRFDDTLRHDFFIG
ncbi:Thioesterase domain-containing protein [Pyrenophora tritici-repentis]|nr:Thioesterase domain-containing protein [Pyrenophora tritici-repentis]KAI0604419.1 Thioesterase domain-containing protein [Pyrenophora tritici-repentis]KAI0616391.1 Thioesterase domain-containing protein [Pyrenophora tritici-repentis]